MLSFKEFGIVDFLLKIIDFFFLKSVPQDSLITLDIIDLEINFSLQIDLPNYLIYLFNFVTQPQGDISGWLVLVLPPCGWSTGFIATPLTSGLKPLFIFIPALPRHIYLFNILEFLPIVALDNPLKYFFLPVGKFNINILYSLSLLYILK